MSLPLAFAELLAGAILVDRGAGALRGELHAGTGTGTSGATSTATSAASGTITGRAGAEKMLAAASAASAAGIAYSSSVQSSGLLVGFRSDCSGFVSWVVSRAIPSFGDQTTVTIPDSPSIAAGQGAYVTLWNRPLAGNSGHVIIDILGSWFESGGQDAGGVHQMTAAGAQSELAGGGFDPLHPIGL